MALPLLSRTVHTRCVRAFGSITITTRIIMTTEQIGLFRSRPLVAQWAASLDEVPTAGLADTALLVWLLDDAWESDALASLMTSLLDDGALGITLCGRRSDAIFMALFELLSKIGGESMAPINVMGGLEPAEIVDEFLATLADAGERWGSTRITLVGGFAEAEEVAALVRSKIEASE